MYTKLTSQKNYGKYNVASIHKILAHEGALPQKLVQSYVLNKTLFRSAPQSCFNIQYSMCGGVFKIKSHQVSEGLGVDLFVLYQTPTKTTAEKHLYA